MAERWFSPAEMARRLGVTPKALRVYEREGLVAPLRTAAGWRAYGPAQFARLHQVLAFKRLGLPLKRIRPLLEGRFAGLDAVLELQERILRDRRDEAARGLELLEAARAKLARDGALSPDDLTQLTRETAMADDEAAKRTRDMFLPFAEKYFTPEERERFSHIPFDPDETARAWEALHAEGAALMAVGDPGSPEAMELARRWMAKVDEFSGGDPEVNRRLRDLWDEAHATPEIRAASTGSPELTRFVGEAYGRAIAAGLVPDPRG